MSAFLIAFIILQVADAASTVVVLRKGGYEANPWLNWAMGKIGVVPALAAFKAAGIAALVYAAGHPGVDYVLAFMCGVYVMVVANNVQVARQLARRAVKP